MPPYIFNRSSIAKVLEIARYSCGFAQSDQLNLWQIRAQILPSCFLPSPKQHKASIVFCGQIAAGEQVAPPQSGKIHF